LVKSPAAVKRTVLQAIQQHPKATAFRMFLKFLIAGVPGLVLAFSANIFFVEILRWPKPVAYAIVVWLQLTVGFVLCRFFVFTYGQEVPFLKAYVDFSLRIGLIRLADWSLYTALVELVHVPYLAAQVINLAIFPAVKFLSVRSIFGRGRVPPTSDLDGK
jgi:putative flippase GtrA